VWFKELKLKEILKEILEVENKRAEQLGAI
jgi:hypothetical protein